MSKLDRRDGECLICCQKKKVRNIDLYIIGSEGLNACHDCEMNIVSYVQILRSYVSEARKQGFMVARRDKEDTK